MNDKADDRSGAETLTLDAIVSATGLHRSALLRYLHEDETRALVGPVGKPARYQRASLPLLQAIADAHAAGTIKPKTAAAMLRARFGFRNPESGLAILPASPSLPFRFSESGIRTEQEGGEAARLTAAMERLATATEATNADTRLWTAEEVGARLRMSPGWVRANVPCVRLGRRVRFRPSDVRRFVSESETEG